MPPAAFYTLVHFGQAGYVLTFLPALVILLARALVEAVGRAPSGCAGRAGAGRSPPRWSRSSSSSTPASSCSARRCRASSTPGRRRLVWRARDEAHDWILSRTAAALREHEAVIRTYVETIRAVYDPDDTALLTELGNPRSYPWLRHAMFYLPEYPIYQLQLGDARRASTRPSPRRP